MEQRHPPGPRGDDLPLPTQHLFDQAGIGKEVKSISMIFAGTNTNGHTGMIKNLKKQSRQQAGTQYLCIALLLLLR